MPAVKGGEPREEEGEAAAASRRVLSHGRSGRGRRRRLGQNRGGGGATAGLRSTTGEWGDTEVCRDLWKEKERREGEMRKRRVAPSEAEEDGGAGAGRRQ